MTNLSQLKAACCLAGCVAGCFALAGCGKKFNPAGGEVQQAQVTPTGDVEMVSVQDPNQFPLVTATRFDAPNKLDVTGSVFPDIDREVPVISLASGRVVDIRARLDDNVKKGQLLLKVQSPDVTSAFDIYLKATNDEQLANKAYLRAQDLFAHGAISQATLEQAQDTEENAKADLAAADQQLATLGVDKNHPSSVVNVYAPISGVIVAQNVTDASATGVTYSGSSTAFTVADLSVVWIICDVYESDLPRVRLAQEAHIQLNAIPGKVFTGRISDIGPVLDPTIRTAKLRIEVPNPGTFRLGMYVTATLLSHDKVVHAVIPATAILHLHDRNWVFVPAGNNHFKRAEVTTGDMQPGDMQEILSGIAPGQQVIKNVLELEATAEAQ